MKKRSKKISIIISLLLILSASLSPTAFASQNTSGSAIVPVTQGGIYGGTQIELLGTVTPTIMSVTMPASISFDMTKNTQNTNKVISPEISIINNSFQDVSVYASSTNVDLSNMPGVRYALSSSGSAMSITTGAIVVESDEIAIGMSSENVTDGALSVDGLYSAMWLPQYSQSGPLVYVPGNSTASVYVVGAVGNAVPEDRFFRISPTMIATYQ